MTVVIGIICSTFNAELFGTDDAILSTNLKLLKISATSGVTCKMFEVWLC